HATSTASTAIAATDSLVEAIDRTWRVYEEIPEHDATGATATELAKHRGLDPKLPPPTLEDVAAKRRAGDGPNASDARRRTGSPSEADGEEGSALAPDTRPLTLEALAAQRRARHASQASSAAPSGSGPEAEPGRPATAEEDEEGDESEGAFNPLTGEINWDCPCLGGMAHGLCGEEFKTAFSCFVYSNAEPKGMDCIEAFQGMQDCFRKHPDVYGGDLVDDEDDDDDANIKVEADGEGGDHGSTVHPEHREAQSSEKTDASSSPYRAGDRREGKIEQAAAVGAHHAVPREPSAPPAPARRTPPDDASGLVPQTQHAGKRSEERD
ncbi:MAG: Oxidoreductase, partial [Phylliscum demangeonii]